ncbi:PP2C family protein-serine/threonine phosphatase [Streptomyces sp. NPDC053755]|uniref:PP2C family protein-serine/threonine phosphatase n=1 Tax=Streptomyces sp. NPDC053755 TaxID=3155815 RepID=UPI003416EAC9
MTVSQSAFGRSQGVASSVSTSWLRAPYPALVACRDGGVVEVNEAAAALFPDMISGAWLADVAPAWLADAHRRLARPPRPRTAPPPARPPQHPHGTAPQHPQGAAPRQGAASSGQGGPPRPAHDPARPEPVQGRHEGRLLRAYATLGEHGDVAWWLADDTDRHTLEQALDSERRRTTFLAEASTRLLASLNTERCLEMTALLAAEHLADAAVVVAPPSGRRYPLVHASGQHTQRRNEAVNPADLPGLAEALQGFPPVPSRWIDPAALPSWAYPDDFGTTTPGSVAVIPLPGHGVPAGALILLRRGGQAAFDTSEELFARLFAARAGAALSAARLYGEQARITRTLMAELLPPRLHQVHGVEFAGGYRASQDSERVGGDFYDVHPGSDAAQEPLAILGDVCGKGLDAAVLTGKIRNTLQAMVPLADDHQNVLTLLNDALLTSHHTRFATLVLASVKRVGAQVRLRLTSAGHPRPLLLRTTGEVEEADTAGTLVGALPSVTSRSATVHLAPGETCLLYTDGITEARGGPLASAMFGEKRLKAAFSECVGLPAEAVVERIQMLAAQWVGSGPHDDMALVAITAPHTTHLTAVNGHTRGRYTG